MRKFLIVALTSIILSGLAGCNKSSVKHIDEGEIHYSLNYIGRQSSVSDAMLPNNMVVKFKDDKILMEIMTPIGNNGIVNIIDPEAGQVDTFINLIGMKFYYSGVYGEIPPGIDPMTDLILEKTGLEKDIFGLNCINIKASLPSSDYVFDIWYTDEIALSNGNESTPFSEIEGVMINFFYRMGDMIIEFEADGVYLKAISDKDFIKGESYRKIDRESMDSIISKMMNL